MSGDQPICPTCGRTDCVYLLLPDVERRNRTRYLLGPRGAEREVTMEEYVAAERQAGFYNTLGHPERPATASFSTTARGGMEGRQEWTYLGEGVDRG